VAPTTAAASTPPGPDAAAGPPPGSGPRANLPAACPAGVARAVPAPWRFRTAANGITVARIAATPLLVVVVLRLTPSWWALGLWAALAFSDAADGWLARRRGTSASGAFLDPLADKFLVLAALASVVALGKFSWAPVALLAGREALITAFRVLVARQGVSVPARRVAKAKTLAEFVTVGLVLLPITWGPQLAVAHVVLWVAVALAWASGTQYLLDSRAAARQQAALTA
jgi:CDP-diacylglycerol--glycerol-3-phosphate 3-phosphatidyltransferase